MNKDLNYYLNLPYKTILEFEPGDNTWIAYCPELGRGTCYAIAETQKGALEILEQAKYDILEYAISEGKEIPEPKFEEEELPSGHFVVRCSKTLHKKLKNESEIEGTSLNQFVCGVLAESVGEKRVHNLYTTLLNSLSKSYNFNRELWQFSNFQIKSPFVSVKNKEEYNPWLLEGKNVEDEKETTGIDWRYFSNTIS